MHQKLAQVIALIGRSNSKGVSLLGTAFAVAKNRVATTAHAIGPDDSELVLIHPRIDNCSSYQDTSDSKVRYSKIKLSEYDPIRDIAILAIEGIEFTFTYKLVGTDRLETSEPVYSLSFPHADHGRMVLTYQSASVGAKILLPSKGVTTKHIVLNTQARPGQSGGPVFFQNSGDLAAMIVGSYAPGGGGGISLGGVDPHTLHQTTHAISSEYILDLLA